MAITTFMVLLMRDYLQVILTAIELGDKEKAIVAVQELSKVIGKLV